MRRETTTKKKKRKKEKKKETKKLKKPHRVPQVALHRFRQWAPFLMVLFYRIY
jgi:hypothetical protein